MPVFHPPSLSRTVAAVLTAALLWLPTSATRATLVFSETVVRASDAVAGDEFGWSVALRGDTLIVGAYEDSDAGEEAGSVYVFVQDPNGHWVEDAELRASDAGPGKRFGNSVAVSDDRGTLIAGAPNRAAYVFRRQLGGQWLEEARLPNIEPNGEPGWAWSVAVNEDGSRVAVGGFWRHSVCRDRQAARGLPNSEENCPNGLVGVYRRDPNGVWMQEATITASDGDPGDAFGQSVAIRGTTLAVGAQRDDDGGNNAGAAYIFRRAGTAWSEEAKLVWNDATNTDEAGWSIALDDDENRVIVGAYSGPPSRAFVYRRDGTTWVQEGLLRDKTLFFAQTVSIHGELAAVAPADVARASGAAGFQQVNVYQRDGIDWEEAAFLFHPGGQRRDEFGWTVSVSDGVVAVGAPGYASESGAVHVFTLRPDLEPLSKAQKRCIAALNKGMIKVAKAQRKTLLRCMKAHARSRLQGTLEDCITSDPSGSLSKSLTKLASAEARRCSDPRPDVAITDPNTAGRAARQLQIDLARDGFGPVFDSGVLLSESAKAESKCQLGLAKDLSRCAVRRLKEFLKCKKQLLKFDTLRFPEQFESCMEFDPGARVILGCEHKFARTLGSRCFDIEPGLVLGEACAGASSTAVCLGERASCRVCRALNQADALARNCDELDDGALNASCP